jgi:hypothetical protein
MSETLKTRDEHIYENKVAIDGRTWRHVREAASRGRAGKGGVHRKPKIRDADIATVRAAEDVLGLEVAVVHTFLMTKSDCVD